jgi:hypothetical protein
MFANGTAIFQPSIETDERDPLGCPHCGRSDRVEKASAIVKQQSGQIFFDRTGVPAAFRSALAVELAEPERPLARSWADAARAILISGALAGVVLIVMFTLGQFDVSVPSAAKYAMYGALALFGALLPAWAIIRTLDTQSRARRQRLAWHDAKERWDLLYYCSRDDVVFLYGQSDCESASRAQLFIRAR